MLRIRLAVVAALGTLALAPAAAQAATWTETFAFGAAGTGPGQFHDPIGLAVAPDDGTIWVADGSNNRLQRFAPDGTAPAVVGAGDFQLVEDVAVENRAFAFASDCYGNRIMRIARGAAGGSTSVLYDSASAAKSGQTLSCPEGLAIGPEGYLYVADTFHDRVVVLDPGAEFPFVRTIGEGRLHRVANVAFDPAGHLVASSGVPETCASTEVVTFDRASGAELAHFGTSGTGPGQLYCVNALGIDAAGNVYVGDAGGRVQAFTPSGQFAGLVAARGTGTGQTAFPMDIVTEADCNLLVMDRDQNRVKRFTISPGGCAALPAVDPAGVPGAGGTTPGTGSGTAGGTGGTTTAPLTVRTAFRPRLSKGGALTVILRCGAKPCDVLVTGRVIVGKGRPARSYRLKSARKHLAAGAGSSVSLRLPARFLPAVQRALKAGRLVRVSVDGRLGGKVISKTTARLKR